MPLYEFRCQACQTKFEQITRDGDPDYGTCPKCESRKTRRLLSRFVIGGQGDLRTSTFHGCHGCYTGQHGHGHHHDSHSQDHAPESHDIVAGDSSSDASKASAAE